MGDRAPMSDPGRSGGHRPAAGPGTARPGGAGPGGRVPAGDRRFRSISEGVADTLRDMILVGELAPEQQLTQEELAERLGVSTMPVREALLRLSHEGLIEARRGRSFRVARTTREDVADLYWLHATLERELTRRAVMRTPELATTLRGIVEEWDGARQHRQLDQLDQLNFRFHRTINRAAAAPTLLRQLRHTLRLIPQHFYSLLPEWGELSSAGHQEITVAVASGDPDAAGDAAARHVLDAGQLLVAWFDDRGHWTPPPSSHGAGLT